MTQRIALLAMVILPLALGLACGSDDTSPADTVSSDAGGEVTSDAADSGQTDTPPDLAGLTEAELALCDSGDLCVVVSYDHCCGSTRRAINAAYQATYEAHPEWQSYYGDDCALIGACMSDEHLNSAYCDEADGVCRLAE